MSREVDQALASAEKALAAAAEHLLTLSSSDWHAPGSTTSRLSAEERSTAPRSSGGSPAGANLDVLTYLSWAEAEVLAVDAAVRESLRLPARTGYRSTGLVIRALGDIRAALPSVSADVLERSASLGHALSRDASRLLGLTVPRKAVTTCPYCESRSIVIDPRNDDVALCANRSCLDDAEARRSWSRAAGEWRIFGWDSPSASAERALSPA